MSILRRVGAFVLGFASLLAGCVEGRTTEDVGEAEQADKYGSGGTNGLDSYERMDEEPALVEATGYQLVKPGGLTVSPQIQNTLLQTAAGVRVFEYAVACAVPAEMTV